MHVLSHWQLPDTEFQIRTALRDGSTCLIPDAGDEIHIQCCKDQVRYTIGTRESDSSHHHYLDLHAWNKHYSQEKYWSNLSVQRLWTAESSPLYGCRHWTTTRLDYWTGLKNIKHTWPLVLSCRIQEVLKSASWVGKWGQQRMYLRLGVGGEVDSLDY